MALSGQNYGKESSIVADEDCSSSQAMGAASSSPCGPASSGSRSDKPRKPPSVTPRSFRRFFTPRSLMRTRQKVSSARRAFQDITHPANNRSRMKQHEDGNVLEPFADINPGRDENATTITRGKRRKTLHFPELTFEARPHSPSDLLSSPTTALGDGRHVDRDLLVPSYPEPLTPESLRFLDDSVLDEEEIIEPKVMPRVQRGWQSSSVSARLLHRDSGVIRDGRRRFHAGSK